MVFESKLEEITIKIRVIGTLIRFSKNHGSVKIKKGLNIRCLLSEIGIPEKNVMLIIVNGEQVDKNYILSDGDEVILYPVIAGG